jgi:class 3 adenylate cyclase/tetratricopeptide (TPR) repeat protein
VTRSCPACHATDLPDRSRFCLSCGAPLPAPEQEGSPPPYTPEHLARDILTSKIAREGERKEVTVLFADVAGSLAMAERLDPEEIHAIMDGLFVLAFGAVHAELGTINQFRGDGFMALFGAPRSRGDDAVRALRAALALSKAADGYSAEVRQRFGVPLALRMGAHTGRVWVGSIGNDLRKDYTAEGPTVGLAARLQESAEPGQILVSESTARRARPFLELRDVGVHRMRGVTRPVRVFELAGTGPFEARFDAERARGLTPFVGRGQELDRLEESWRGAQRTGLCLVEVCGEAGIGKSRLALEHLSRTGPSAPVLESRCRESGTTQAYRPWLEILRHWPAWLARAPEATQLAHEFGGDTSDVAGTREGFAARLLALLEEAAEESGVIVLIEDAQWLDPSSWAVLRSMAERGSAGRILILTTRRGEPPPLHEAATAERIELGPLALNQSERLAASIIGELEDAPTWIEFAVGRGAGNPLFIEEVARALRQGTEETRRAARLEVELLRAPERIPSTLNGVITARIDALPDAAKRLLQAASVIGLPFDGTLLGELEPDSAEETATLAEDLLANGLLERGAQTTFEFRHVLVRDAAYSQLLHSRRRELHHRCAEALVNRGVAATPDGASFVGTHYDRAGDGSRAAHHLTAAGRAYLKVHAPSEAATHLGRAWELHQQEPVSDEGERVSTGLALVSALNGLDRASDAAEVLAALETESLGSKERSRVGRTSIEEGWVRFSEQNDVEGGRRLIERGLALVRSRPDGHRAEMSASWYLSRLHEQDGEINAAVRCAEDLLEVAHARGDPFFSVLGLSARGSALCHTGEANDALRALLEGVALAERGQNETAIGMASAFLAKGLTYVGQPAKALDVAEHARRAGDRARQVGTVHHAAVWSGYAHLLLDEPERAMEQFDLLPRLKSRWPGGWAHRAQGLVALGRWDQAHAEACRCLKLHPPRLVRARALCTAGLGLALARPEEHERATASIVESIDLCKRLGLSPHLAEAKQALAVVADRCGEAAQARDCLEEAIRLFEECGMPLHAERARTAL